MPKPVTLAQELLAEHFPTETRRLLVPALRRGYAAVDRLMEAEPIFATPAGKFHKGDLNVLAVELELHRLTVAGRLPFEATWEYYEAPTGKHLVLRSSAVRVTINQVKFLGQKPRPAAFRDSYGLPNMRYLFNDWNEAAERENNLPHVLLLHGYQDLSFAQLGVPNPAANDLIECTANLLNEPYEVTEPVAEEGPSASPEPEIIEELSKLIRDDE